MLVNYNIKLYILFTKSKTLKFIILFIRYMKILILIWKKNAFVE